jgi:hypothetical protein
LNIKIKEQETQAGRDNGKNGQFSNTKENIFIKPLSMLTKTKFSTSGKASEKNTQTTLYTKNKQNLQILIWYLHKYPLKSKKNISFIRFKKIFRRIYDKLIRQKRSIKRFLRIFIQIQKC